MHVACCDGRNLCAGERAQQARCGLMTLPQAPAAACGVTATSSRLRQNERHLERKGVAVRSESHDVRLTRQCSRKSPAVPLA